MPQGGGGAKIGGSEFKPLKIEAERNKKEAKWELFIEMSVCLKGGEN